MSPCFESRAEAPAEEGLREDGIISLHRLVIRQLRISNRRTDLQPALACYLDHVERQMIDVNDQRVCFDVQLHEIDQRGAAGEEPHVRALLRGLRRAAAAIAAAGSAGRLKLEGLIKTTPAYSYVLLRTC